MARETTQEKDSRPAGSKGLTAMKISIAASLVLHAVALLAIQKAFPINWFIPMRTYQVELLRPSVEELEKEKESGTDLAKTKGKEAKPPEDSEETISLDTKDERYSSYARVVKERLMARWEYPQQAFENLIEGKLLVIFSLSRDGALRGVKVLDSSGFPILDRETVRTIRASAPFPPFPGSVKVSKLNIKAKFDYRLASGR